MLNEALEGQAGELLVELFKEQQVRFEGDTLRTLRGPECTLAEARYKAGICVGLAIATDIVNNIRKNRV